MYERSVFKDLFKKKEISYLITIENVGLRLHNLKLHFAGYLMTVWQEGGNDVKKRLLKIVYYVELLTRVFSNE